MFNPHDDNAPEFSFKHHVKNRANAYRDRVVGIRDGVKDAYEGMRTDPKAYLKKRYQGLSLKWKLLLVAEILCVPLDIWYFAAYKPEESALKERIAMLADGIAQGNLQVTLDDAAGKPAGLSRKNVSGESLLDFADTVMVHIANASGEPICDVPVRRFRLIEALNGKEQPLLADKAAKNLEKLGKLCGFSDEKIKAMNAMALFKPDGKTRVERENARLKSILTEPAKGL